MQLEVKVEELRKKKIFLCTPMYGGMACGMYMKSCLDLQSVCAQYGVEVRFSFIFNESLITRARNYLVDEFLRAEGFTHLLFIDADIHFDPRDVIALLALDKDVIGGPYPKKSIKWGAVKDALKKHPELPVSEMEKVAGDFVFNPAPGTEKFSVAEPVEVLEIGTGFMMVKREVFDRFREAYPEFAYRPDHVGQANFDGTRYIHAYFDTVIDYKRTVMVDGVEKEVGGSDRYLSEDYMFCQWWRRIGGKIWLCPWMKTHHVGTYAFVGDLPAVANYVGTL
jgi:hypothetical protein